MMWFLMMLSTTFAQQAQGQKPTISVVSPQVTNPSQIPNGNTVSPGCLWSEKKFE